MNTAVNGVCYKSKTLKNGEHPIHVTYLQARKGILLKREKA